MQRQRLFGDDGELLVPLCQAAAQLAPLAAPRQPIGIAVESASVLLAPPRQVLADATDFERNTFRTLATCARHLDTLALLLREHAYQEQILKPFMGSSNVPELATLPNSLARQHATLLQEMRIEIESLHHIRLALMEAAAENTTGYTQSLGRVQSELATRIELLTDGAASGSARSWEEVLAEPIAAAVLPHPEPRPTLAPAGPEEAPQAAPNPVPQSEVSPDVVERPANPEPPSQLSRSLSLSALSLPFKRDSSNPIILSRPSKDASGSGFGRPHSSSDVCRDRQTGSHDAGATPAAPIAAISATASKTPRREASGAVHLPRDHPLLSPVAEINTPTSSGSRSAALPPAKPAAPNAVAPTAKEPTATPAPPQPPPPQPPPQPQLPLASASASASEPTASVTLSQSGLCPVTPGSPGTWISPVIISSSEGVNSKSISTESDKSRVFNNDAYTQLSQPAGSSQRPAQSPVSPTMSEGPPLSHPVNMVNASLLASDGHMSTDASDDDHDGMTIGSSQRPYRRLVMSQAGSPLGSSPQFDDVLAKSTPAELQIAAESGPQFVYGSDTSRDDQPAAGATCQAGRVPEPQEVAEVRNEDEQRAEPPKLLSRFRVVIKWRRGCGERDPNPFVDPQPEPLAADTSGSSGTGSSKDSIQPRLIRRGGAKRNAISDDDNDNDNEPLILKQVARRRVRKDGSHLPEQHPAT
ncbi:hypothetical protein BC831DRAFT_547165 [Entophlyctis helioformis]|nr:hypothetical protein BC831DRAFT_547165 [Entophlyctis helioformis]